MESAAGKIKINYFEFLKKFQYSLKLPLKMITYIIKVLYIVFNYFTAEFSN